MAFSKFYSGFWICKGNVVSGNHGVDKNNQHQMSLSAQISTITAG
jgi:hypothetical protein